MLRSKLLIRKRNGVWKGLLLIPVAGRLFPYAAGITESWADVPTMATELWEMHP